MKKHLIALLGVIILSTPTFSQQTTYGFKFGFNAAKWGIGEPTATFENKFRIGLITGFNADIPVSGPVTVQSELVYAMFGSQFSQQDEFAKYKVNYMLLPVMAKYNLDNGMSFLAGPQLGLLVSAKSNLDGEKYDFKDDMKKTDIFFVFGAEYAMHNGIALGFRYQHGLMNTEKDAEVPFIKNRGISLTATYKLKHSFREVLKTLFK